MTTQQPVPYPLRMSPDLRAKLESRASANGRSLNAEIIAVLQNAVDATAGPPDLDTFADQLADKMTDRLAERLAKRLKGK